MVSGHQLVALVEQLLKYIEASTHPSSERHQLMSTVTHLSAAVDALIKKASDDDTKIATLTAELAAAQQTPTGDAELDPIIAKIEAVTGPVEDPAPAPVDPAPVDHSLAA